MFDILKFSRRFQFPTQLVHHAIKILESEGYLLLSESKISGSKLMILVDRFQLNTLLQENQLTSKVLDLALRSYTGLFTDYVKISESFLAEKLNISDHAVKNALQILEKKQVLSYLTPSFLPRIIYTSERIHSDHLSLSSKSLKLRKQNAENQLFYMIKYIEEPLKCRTNIALFYFNEIPKSNCGHCDHCIQNKNNSSIQTTLLNLLSHEKTLIEIINESPFSKEESIQAVRLLLDEGKLIRKGNLIRMK